MPVLRIFLYLIILLSVFACKSANNEIPTNTDDISYTITYNEADGTYTVVGHAALTRNSADLGHVPIGEYEEHGIVAWTNLAFALGAALITIIGFISLLSKGYKKDNQSINLIKDLLRHLYKSSRRLEEMLSSPKTISSEKFLLMQSTGEELLLENYQQSTDLYLNVQHLCVNLRNYNILANHIAGKFKSKRIVLKPEDIELINNLIERNKEIRSALIKLFCHKQGKCISTFYNFRKYFNRNREQKVKYVRDRRILLGFIREYMRKLYSPLPSTKTTNIIHNALSYLYHPRRLYHIIHMPMKCYHFIFRSDIRLEQRFRFLRKIYNYLFEIANLSEDAQYYKGLIDTDLERAFDDKNMPDFDERYYKKKYRFKKNSYIQPLKEHYIGKYKYFDKYSSRLKNSHCLQRYLKKIALSPKFAYWTKNKYPKLKECLNLEYDCY